MALDSTTVELRKDGIVVDVPIPVAIDINDPATVFVYAGAARQPVPVGEYILTLDNNAQNPKTWPTYFKITPKPALITRIGNLQDNRIYIQRTLPLTTDFEDTDAFVRRKIEEEFDEVHMKLQQLDHDNDLDGLLLARALLVPEPETGKTVPPIIMRANKVFAYDNNGVPIPSNLTLAQIEAGVTVVPDPGYIVGSVTLHVPSVYPTVQAAMDYLKDKYFASDAVITIAVTGHVTVADEIIVKMDHMASGRIRVVGIDAPLSRTVVKCTAHPTGEAFVPGDPFIEEENVGGYDITLELDDVTDVSVGDVLALGWNSTKNEDNDLKWGYVGQDGIPGRIGGLRITGTACEFGLTESSTLPGDGTDGFGGYMPMLLFTTGEVRSMTAIIDQFHGTVESPLSVEMDDNEIYWLWVPHSPGTVSSAGGTTNVVITGVGTDLNTRCGVGDFLMTRDGGLARITGVVSATEIRVARTPAITAGSKFAIVSNHQQHRGAFPIAAVDTVLKTVTYKNKHCSDNAYAAPRRFQLVPASGLSASTNDATKAKIYRNVLKTTHVAGKGVAVNQSFNWIDNLAFVGPGTDASTGASWEEGDGYSGAHANFGPNTVLTEWGYGIKNWHGSFYADQIVIGNICGTAGVYNFQGSCWIRNATIHGGGTCMTCGPGSSSYASTAYFIGGYSFGIHRLTANFLADGARTYGCHNYGRHTLTGVGVHDTEGWNVCNGLLGTGFSHGSDGRMTFNINLGNGSEGVVVTRSSFQANDMLCMANGGDGIQTESGDIDLQHSGFRNNGGAGVLATEMSRVYAGLATAMDNGSHGFRSLGGSRVHADETDSVRNSGFDYSAAEHGSFMRVNDPIANPLGVSTYSPKPNATLAGALIVTNAVTPSHKTNAVVSHGAFVFDVASIAAHGFETMLTPADGAEILDSVKIHRPDLINPNVSIEGTVTSPDTLTIVFRNHGTVAVDMAEVEYRYTVTRAQ